MNYISCHVKHNYKEIAGDAFRIRIYVFNKNNLVKDSLDFQCGYFPLPHLL